MDEKKNRWGTSLGEAFGLEDPLAVKDGETAYYYGADGHHAVCDAVGGNLTLIIDGAASTLQGATGANQLFQDHHIDLHSGWSSRP